MYKRQTLATLATNKGTTVLVYGSEFAKGVGYNAADEATVLESRTANEPKFKSFSNKPER